MGHGMPYESGTKGRISRQQKKNPRKRLKHALVDSVFDADSKYVISFDTDRSLLIEICEIPVKRSKR